MRSSHKQKQITAKLLILFEPLVLIVKDLILYKTVLSIIHKQVMEHYGNNLFTDYEETINHCRIIANNCSFDTQSQYLIAIINHVRANHMNVRTIKILSGGFRVVAVCKLGNSCHVAFTCTRFILRHYKEKRYTRDKLPSVILNF